MKGESEKSIAVCIRKIMTPLWRLRKLETLEHHTLPIDITEDLEQTPGERNTGSIDVENRSANYINHTLVFTITLKYRVVIHLHAPDLWREDQCSELERPRCRVRRKYS